MKPYVDSSLNLISLCSGAGQLDIGVSRALARHGIRARTLAYVERQAEACAVLRSRMEDEDLEPAPVWSGNLEDFPYRLFRGVAHGLVAGFPCQPHSVAGKQEGRDDERNLLPAILNVADGVWADVLFLENVAGLKREFDYIAGLLLQRGFCYTWGCLRAADVGASHRRDRWFCIAYRGDMADRLRLYSAGWGVSGIVDGPPGALEADGEQRERCWDSADDSSIGMLADSQCQPRYAEQLDEPRGGPRRAQTTDHGSMSGDPGDGLLADSHHTGAPEHAGEEQQIQRESRPRGERVLANGERPGLEGHRRDGHGGHEPGRQPPGPAGPASAGGGELGDTNIARKDDDRAGCPPRDSACESGGKLGDTAGDYEPGGGVAVADAGCSDIRRSEDPDRQSREGSSSGFGRTGLPLFAPGPRDGQWFGILSRYPFLAPALPEMALRVVGGRIFRRNKVASQPISGKLVDGMEPILGSPFSTQTNLNDATSKTVHSPLLDLLRPAGPEEYQRSNGGFCRVPKEEVLQPSMHGERAGEAGNDINEELSDQKDGAALPEASMRTMRDGKETLNPSQRQELEEQPSGQPPDSLCLVPHVSPPPPRRHSSAGSAEATMRVREAELSGRCLQHLPDKEAHREDTSLPRADMLRIIGNGVVPAQSEHAFFQLIARLRNQ